MIRDSKGKGWPIRLMEAGQVSFRIAHRTNTPDDEVMPEAAAFERLMVEILQLVEANSELGHSAAERHDNGCPNGG